MSGKRVLSIGQCLADHSALSRTFQKNFGAEVVSADSGAEALALLRQEPFHLVLVNRVLNADGSSGVRVIQEIRQQENLTQVPVMLVSNYEDAQQEALAAGALPGFGKSSLGHPRMLARVKEVLGEGGPVNRLDNVNVR
ncbi:MAG: response regulator [Planctomycetes bacterium]|nr:response regulator [Planctomycetota bacterium]